MTRPEAIAKLTVDLTALMDTWTGEKCETTEWESLNTYVGNDTHRLMAQAAMAVLEAVVDVNGYHREEGTDFSR